MRTGPGPLLGNGVALFDGCIEGHGAVWEGSFFAAPVFADGGTVLAYLRKGETFAELAARFGVSTATAWRYVTETAALMAARSPKLRRALRGAGQSGHAYLVIDDTLIPIDQVAADRPRLLTSTLS